MYTEDRDAWWELDHAFAWHIESLLRSVMPNQENPLVDKMLDEDMYQSALSYARGLDEDDFVQLVKAVAPDLLKMVEV